MVRNINISNVTKGQNEGARMLNLVFQKGKKFSFALSFFPPSLPLLQQPQLFNSHCVLLVQNVPEICSTLVPNLQSKVIRNKQDENMILNRERSKAHLNLSLAKDDRLKKMCFLRL